MFDELERLKDTIALQHQALHSGCPWIVDLPGGQWNLRSDHLLHGAGLIAYSSRSWPAWILNPCVPL
jgi:hypothetical protein